MYGFGIVGWESYWVSLLSILGPALTAGWSKAPPLTARCLSTLPGFESRPGHVRKLPVTWG